MAFYLVVLLLGLKINSKSSSSTAVRLVTVAATTMGVVVSAYLAYAMAFRMLGAVCVLCLCSYVCNIALFLVTILPVLRSV